MCFRDKNLIDLIRYHSISVSVTACCVRACARLPCLPCLAGGVCEALILSLIYETWFVTCVCGVILRQGNLGMVNN